MNFTQKTLKILNSENYNFFFLQKNGPHGPHGPHCGGKQHDACGKHWGKHGKHCGIHGSQARIGTGTGTGTWTGTIKYQI